MKTLREFLRENKILLLTWFTGILFTLQIFNLHSYVVMTVDSQAIVASNDDDAGTNLAKTVKTRWWKDNGWVLYGPGYFRLNHSIHYFWQRTADPVNSTPTEVWERTAHHAIMTVSLLSVAALCLVIAAFVTQVWWMRFLCAFGLVSAFCSVPVYAEFILRAHPDMLFSFICVAALGFTVKMLQAPNEKLWFWLSATLWGFSVSAKMTITICAPGFVLLFVPPFNKANFKRGLRYLGIMLLSYFLIGFPQTIVLDRPFIHIMKLQSISAAPTWDSVTHWLSVFVDHLWPLLLVMALAAVDFDVRKHKMPKGVAWRLWAFVLTPFLIMPSKNMLMGSDHYTVSFVVMVLVVVAMFLPAPDFLRKINFPIVKGVLFFALIMALFGSTPPSMQVELDKRLKCREQSRDLLQRQHEFYKQGLNTWVDPYTPYVNGVAKDRVEVSWEKTWSGYARGSWNALALNRNVMNNFAGPNEPSPYHKADIPGWAGVREFYLAFTHGDEAKTPEGHIFKKVFQNSCGYELWLKQ